MPAFGAEHMMSLADLKRSPDGPGDWLFIPGKAEAAPDFRAYVPYDKSPAFANEPAIEWRGSIDVPTVRAVSEAGLSFVSQGACECEIWAPGAPDPRVFVRETIGAIAGYVGEWSSRANVSLTIRGAGVPYPLVYVWGHLRGAEDVAEASDEVGIKLDRGLIGTEVGVRLVAQLYDHTKTPETGSNIAEFLYDLRKKGLL